MQNCSNMETWKEIPGLPGYYQVSDKGRVATLKHGFRIYRPEKTKTGYYQVCIERKRYKIHRLVSLAFVPNPDGLPQINHKNEIKTDNRADNLEWCTAKYNVNYGSCIKRRSKVISKAVRCIETGEIFSSCNEAGRQMGLDFSHIAKCCRGVLSHHKNFHFEFVG